MDAFRVAPESEKGYRPMMRNEVSLAFPDSSASEARIQFPDEKAELKYYVSASCRKKRSFGHRSRICTGIASSFRPFR